MDLCDIIEDIESPVSVIQTKDTALLSGWIADTALLLSLRVTFVDIEADLDRSDLDILIMIIEHRRSRNCEVIKTFVSDSSLTVSFLFASK